MNKTHRTTLAAIFASPVRADIKWSDIESLVRGLGGEVHQRAGSRVMFVLNGVRANFHAPHPSPDTDKGAVKSVRQFLSNAGVKP
ncbi:MAG TPA: type II toxin-antitoxin system HicA family toxin [Azospirillum sp.]|nr:type II toxin-antitoxin system HicA family toxin [Azospirillum sp.]